MSASPPRQPIYPPVDSTTHRPPDLRRWWLAVMVATGLSLPISWLLSYAAALPFFLGLFFFVLFGLLIGATAFRIAAPGRPYPPGQILAGTTVIVGICWFTSLAKEAHDLPKDIASRAVNQTRDLGDRTLEEFRTEVADAVNVFLHQSYPPGGVLGYVRWVLTDGTIRTEAVPLLRRPIVGGQTRWLWAIRAVLSMALLAFGVASQTLTLRRAVDADTGSDVDADSDPNADETTAL